MHYFFLGNTPDLSLLELTSLYPGEYRRIKEGIVAYAADLLSPGFDRLGGTRKIALLVKIVRPPELLAELTQIIAEDTSKNVAVTDYAGTSLSSAEIIGIKKAVHQSRPLRFVSTTTEEHELLMLAHQHVAEFNLLPHEQGIAIAKTIWIYDAESWVTRDRKKPYRDIKRGMLPPKLARIMLNLASRGESNLKVADPFCGTGTILVEALLLGNTAIGSDNDDLAVEGALANCAWATSFYGLKPEQCRVFVSDATHFVDQAGSVDVIVTEPYMGPLLDERNPSSLEKIRNIAKGLDKLYRGSFKSWQKILKPGARVVMSIPIFHVYNRTIETISLDYLGELGYNYISSVPYSKPGAAVVRNITILEKK